MGRKPDGKTARTEQVCVRLSKEGMEQVDALRGDLTRAAWVRMAIAREAQRQDRR